jgi:hypothetical protein
LVFIAVEYLGVQASLVAVSSYTAFAILVNNPVAVTTATLFTKANLALIEFGAPSVFLLRSSYAFLSAN